MGWCEEGSRQNGARIWWEIAHPYISLSTVSIISSRQLVEFKAIGIQTLEGPLVTKRLSSDGKGEDGAEERIVEVVTVDFVSRCSRHAVNVKPWRVSSHHVHDMR